MFHVGTTAIPTQAIIYSPRAQNNKIELLHETSLYDIRETKSPPADELTVLDNLRLFTLEAALTRVPEAFFAAKPLEAEMALNSVRDASGILRLLLSGGHSTVAGRLAGAFRRIGRGDLAGEIVSAMRAAEHNVPESDPFAEAPWVGRRVGAGEAAIIRRLHGLWALTRDTVLATFPKPPGLPGDREAYLRTVDEIYLTDAYHSLSIEGYEVTPELIERVRTGAWSPETNQEDRISRSAMAARGYWQAFNAVKRGVSSVLAGAPAAELARDAHREWYRELFQPSVAAGNLAPAALAGYRNEFVYLKTSRYVPPRWEVVRDAMPTLFDLMVTEPEPSVRAVLGHWLIGYIHPYMDGNGRIARFLMNFMLASGGYPWTVIHLEDRNRYLSALDRASIDQDIQPFARFIAERIAPITPHP